MPQYKIILIMKLFYFNQLIVNQMQRRSQSQTPLKSSIELPSNTLRRLLQDLEEIQQERLDSVLVVAAPLPEQMCIWHANIFGPLNTIYEGGVFHFELIIPPQYPNIPPDVRMLTEIPHPLIHNQRINIPLLQPIQQRPNRKFRGQGHQQGWNPAFSIQSLLIQLQSELFNFYYDENSALQAINEANQFKCSKCKHCGIESIWPNNDERCIKNMRQEYSHEQLIRKELCCFSTKRPFVSTDAVKGCSLGVLVSTAKKPRTLTLKEAVCSLDYVSLEAFQKDKIRQDSQGNRFYNHWLPLYFGKEDNKEKVMHLLQRSLSVIMTGTAKAFKPEFVLDVFPLLTQDVALKVMLKEQHFSIRSLRILTQLQLLWLMCMEKWPELYEKADSILQKFIEDENFRHKDFTPDIGLMKSLLLVSKKFKFMDLFESYQFEQFDRMIFWVTHQHPEILGDAMTPKERVDVTFNDRISSYHLHCFRFLYLSEVNDRCKNHAELVESLESTFGYLPEQLENYIQKQVFAIQRDITSYEAYYRYLGIPVESVDIIDAMLKQALQNSERKKYHGDTLIEIPQSLSSFDLNPSVLTYMNLNDAKQIASFFNATEETWKNRLCAINRWVQNVLAIESEISPTQLVILYNSMHDVNLNDDDLKLQWLETEWRDQHRYVNAWTPVQTWKSVYMKIELEKFLENISSFDRKILDDFFNVVAASVTDLNFNLKSLISPVDEQILKLQNLESFSLIDKSPPTPQLFTSQYHPNHLSTMLFMMSVTNKKLKSITYRSLKERNTGIKLLAPLLNMKNSLKSVSIIDCNFFIDVTTLPACQILVRTLQSFTLINSIFNIPQPIQFESNTLEEFHLVQNMQIPYYGSFLCLLQKQIEPKTQVQIPTIYLQLDAPNLKSLTTSSILSQPREIWPKLEILIIAPSVEFYESFMKSDFFFQLIANSSSLQILHFITVSHMMIQVFQIVNHLAKAIAQNQIKTKSLKEFKFPTLFCRYQVLKEFCQAFLSEQSNLLGGEYLKFGPQFHLNSFEIFGGKFHSRFDIKNGSREKFMEEQSAFRCLLRQASLKELSFVSCNFKSQDAHFLSYMLDPTSGHSQLKVLDLRQNSIGDSGAKAIGFILKHVKTLKLLDLSVNEIGARGCMEISKSLGQNYSLKALLLHGNKIKLEGAKKLGESLGQNQTLELLDISANELKDADLHWISMGLKINLGSKLDFIDLTKNRITVLGAQELLEARKLGEVHLKNNKIKAESLRQFKIFCQNYAVQSQIDILRLKDYLDPEIQNRTIWISPQLQTEDVRLQAELANLGPISEIRQRMKAPYPNSKKSICAFTFVEFENPESVLKAQQMIQRGVKVFQRGRVYKAGSSTFQYIKEHDRLYYTNNLPQMPQIYGQKMAMGIQQDQQSLKNQKKEKQKKQHLSPMEKANQTEVDSSDQDEIVLPQTPCIQQTWRWKSRFSEYKKR